MTAFDPTVLALAWGAAASVWVTAALVGVRVATRLPPAAPAALDAYAFACLAGGPMRVQEAARAALVVRATSGSGRRPDAVHPVEAAVVGAATREQGWRAAWAIAVDYRKELVRAGLLHDPVRLLALAPAVLVTVAMTAGCIVALVRLTPAVGPHGPVGLTVLHLFGLCATLFLYRAFAVGRISRRGRAVLARAQARHADLRPRGRSPAVPPPAELALAVALFGLREWRACPPLGELYDSLYPPVRDTGG